MSNQHPRRGCIDIIFVTLTIFNPDLYYRVMIIDAHIHIWHRDMIPDKAIENYLEPLKKLKGMYGGVFDFGLDEEIPFDRKKFLPHVTLTRKAECTKGKAFLPAFQDSESMRVNGISLMKSERGKHGMVYTEVDYVRAL